MRIILSLFTILFFAACGTTSMIQVPANQSVDIETNEYKNSKVKLRNRSAKGIDVKVVDKNSGEFISGFGLGAVGSAHVSVAENGQLKLINTTDKTIKVGYTVKENTYRSKSKKATATKKEIEKPQPAKRSAIQIYLTNESANSIPLVIPSVMNPNLSPFSKSGVDLRMGQKIFFKKKGKKYLLFEVDESIKAEQKIEVSSLIKKRKKELGLE